MGRERVQTRADPDTVEGIEQYREERELSHSEAVRRVLRAGLRVKQQERDQANKKQPFWSSLFGRTNEPQTYNSGMNATRPQVIVYTALLYISVMVTVAAL